MSSYLTMKRAFSLVELSIVLVILGLLVGGVLSGQSLIHASELRAVIAEYQRYNAAVYSFRDKYFALPGDMINATTFWGKDNADCPGNTGIAATPGTCNGNGDGVVTGPVAVSSTGESFEFWRQLADAGLVEGMYSGLSGSGGANQSIFGTNSPKSHMSNAGWNANTGGVFAGDANDYALDYGNEFMLGASTATNYGTSAALKPEDAWNIDTKLDDGKPGTGKIVPKDVPGFGVAGSCTTSTSKTDYAGSYNLGSAPLACALFFVKQF